MDKKHGINISIRDRVFLMWQASMALVQSYEMYVDETDDKEIIGLFANFAEEEGVHASKLLEILRKIEDKK